MRLELVDDIAFLRLEGGRANAMSPEWLTGLDRLVAEVAGLGERARAVVLTGYDRFFSAGLALPALIDLDRPTMAGFMNRFSDSMLGVFTLPLPVVAAVNGHAIAGGCVLALQADVRCMAASSGRIGLTEVQLGLGLPPIVLETLRTQVPAGSLVPIALEGRLFGPDEALRLGLVDEVVPADALLDRAMARARALAALPGDGCRRVKASLRAPVVAAVRSDAARADAEGWLDGWFSEAARARIRATVAGLQRA